MCPCLVSFLITSSLLGQYLECHSVEWFEFRIFVRMMDNMNQYWSIIPSIRKGWECLIGTCCFLLAEEWNKWKTYFSQGAGRLGSLSASVWGGQQGHEVLDWQFFLLPSSWRVRNGYRRRLTFSPPRVINFSSPEIWHHKVWRTWLFIAYSYERWLYYWFSLPHSYISL